MPLPDDSLEKWVYKEHTRVKHEILSKYLSGWSRILGKFHNLNIFDCFAGRGKYADGSEGSPLIIIKKLAEIKEKMKRPNEASCIFIEKNDNNFRNLHAIVENEIKHHPEKYKDWLEVEYFNDEFANVAREVVDKYGKNLAPSFFFIDPFGFTGVSFNIVKSILSIKRTEAFITFMARDVNRFLESSKHQINIEDLYGIENVQETLNLRYPRLSREEALLRLYRDRLHEDVGVRYTLPFKVCADERLQTTYYLVHATNHPKGCKLMKEIMCKTGTEGRFGYFGPANGQLTLDLCDKSGFKNFLLKHFAGRRLSFENIINETLMDTYFIEKDYRLALRELEKEGYISIRGKGPKGGLPLTVEIIFPPRDN